MILFKQVSKSFADQATAINKLNLDIKEGDLWVITGPSGAGKTTLMKLLIGEYQPTEGEVLFENQSVHKLKGRHKENLRRQIGVVFQDYKLIEDMNVWENIALPLYIAGKKETEIASRVTDLLNLIALPEKALHFPKQLSGGEAQRVSIARALAMAPKVIFADEPTGNLDKNSSIKIAKLLQKINELGTTLLFATHDENIVKVLSDAKRLDLSHSTSDDDDDDKKDSKKTKASNKKEESK
jgi:cell division transport system ATP-binding protein